MLQGKISNGIHFKHILICGFIIGITAFFVQCNIIKNSEPPEYILIYEEDVQFTGVVPPLEAAFPYTENYSVSGDRFLKISERESDRWRFGTDGIEYKYIYHEKKYLFHVIVSSENPSDWIFVSVENQSNCIEDPIETFRKEIQDPDYKCEVYYTPEIPGDYDRIIPMLKQMNTVNKKGKLTISVWEFGNGYFHLRINDTEENNLSEAVFYKDEKISLKSFPKRPNVKNMELSILKRTDIKP